jgi:alcohol dehydrogenase class IV
MSDRFYNTTARKGFHWPGRILVGEHVLSTWLAERGQTGIAVIADRAFADHDIVRRLGGARAIVARETRADDVAYIVKDMAARPPEILLALGGGATIDAAKAVATFLRFGGLDIAERRRQRQAPNLVAAPTTAGSGSETSRFFILADPDTGIKKSTRSWTVTPGITLLDPALLHGSGAPRLLLGAFDAAMHLWETHIARGERSAVTDALAVSFLPRILAHLPEIVSGEAPPVATLLTLMEASAMAGIAISNVRTGMIHTLGESLAAQCTLPHPLTLRVFLRPVIESYAPAIRAHVTPMLRMADIVAAWGAPWSVESFIAAWENAFATLGQDAHIRAAFAARRPSLDSLGSTAARDTTLTKENPLPVDPAQLWEIAGAGLAPFLGQPTGDPH